MIPRSMNKKTESSVSDDWNFESESKNPLTNENENYFLFEMTNRKYHDQFNNLDLNQTIGMIRTIHLIHICLCNNNKAN